MTRLLLLLVAWIGRLPLPWVRALGTVLGWVLYWLVGSRRRVVLTNLRLCFPDWSDEKLRKSAREVFYYFGKSWLDRGWLWHGSPQLIRKRLRLCGATQALQGAQPVVIFAPHFMGLDAAWTAITQQLPREFITIYTDQANKISDAWILRGRQRFGRVRLFGRIEGVKPIVTALRSGAALYLLPDMNFGPEESVFVPFYGVPAATVPSLSRFARLGRAKVVPLVACMTDSGYDIEVQPAWDDFPGPDPVADTALMNLRLQDMIDRMPTQYYWVHKRFKDRPAGYQSLY